MKKLFSKNIGRKGRILRFSLAFLLLVGAFYFSSIGLFIGSLFVFFEACMGWCAFFQLFGKKSCKIKK